jgi:hypothetical protein
MHIQKVDDVDSHPGLPEDVKVIDTRVKPTEDYQDEAKNHECQDALSRVAVTHEQGNEPDDQP